MVWLFLLFLIPIEARATHPSIGAPATDAEYEIDYEEEPGGSAEASAPAGSEAPPSPRSRKTTSRKIGTGTGVQGSRAKNRFSPLLKPDAKSIYRKDGKPLDVDSD